MQPLISAEELLKQPNGAFVLLDARSGPKAQQQYQEQHLAGALWVDLEKDLAAPGNPAQGGRHPLPQVAAFAGLLGRLGIGPATSVVVYDDKAGANAAARCWWMLRALGHQAV
ncbi:sulfurtransferase [Hymenobacter sp. BT730]|uniref:sulfurtransferase n=1 Tax=Hymenobacter sp. BT730 TaxID=3063332 RepID=UPI0026E013E7|nr:rhodanese-like domain-containing protein [Hymenobacter sp. BT730]